MEDNFDISWEDSGTVVQGEEVICSIENEILPEETEEFTGGEQPEQTILKMEQAAPAPENIIYISEGNVLVMESGDEPVQDQFMQVAEEIVTEEWAEGCPEEIVVGSEEAVGGTEEQTNEDFDIPLPTDQDEYTTSRPYPCDFCSRRFRKKANLMNHMVAHQTDRPHGCNLCGVSLKNLKCDIRLFIHFWLLYVRSRVPKTIGKMKLKFYS